MRQYNITEYDMEDYKAFRDNITTSEVIKILERIDRGYIGGYNYSGSEDDYERYKLHVALWKAIDTLEDGGINV